MKYLFRKCSLVTAVALMVSSLSFAGPVETAKEFLSFAYGKEVDINALCHPHDDLWMLSGIRNDEALEALGAAKLKVKSTGVVIDVIGRDIAMVEMREGKVDPSFNLEAAYGIHRRLVLNFIYASLPQDSDAIARLVTHPKNVSFGRAPKVSYGDMDQYGEIIALLPVVRFSKPGNDKQSHSITYRLPLGPEGLLLRLVKAGNTWKIDTSSKVTLPLEFFFR